MGDLMSGSGDADQPGYDHILDSLITSDNDLDLTENSISLEVECDVDSFRSTTSTSSEDEQFPPTLHLNNAGAAFFTGVGGIAAADDGLLREYNTNAIPQGVSLDDETCGLIHKSRASPGEGPWSPADANLGDFVHLPISWQSRIHRRLVKKQSKYVMKQQMTASLKSPYKDLEGLSGISTGLDHIKRWMNRILKVLTIAALAITLLFGLGVYAALLSTTMMYVSVLLLAAIIGLTWILRA